MEDLETLRKKLNKTDEKLVKVLAERFSITEEVGNYKKKNNIKPIDKKREAKVFKTKRALAKKLGVNPDLVEKLFKEIIKEVRKNHKAKISKKK